MTQTLTFAVIADTHGNAFALERVLQDIAGRGVDYVVNLGDNVNGPIDPARTAMLLRSGGALAGRPWFHVRGNGDRMTAEGGASASGSAKFARERLSADTLRWLGDLPLTIARDGWLACHGSPQSDTDYLLEKVTATGVAPRPATEVEERLENVDASLVLCGHTHLPRIVRLSGGRVVVNPGSIGLPAYDDTVPFPHKIENESPDASFALISGSTGKWEVELVQLEYDWRAAAVSARANGWPEWARNLETGLA